MEEGRDAPGLKKEERVGGATGREWDSRSALRGEDMDAEGSAVNGGSEGGGGGGREEEAAEEEEEEEGRVAGEKKRLEG